MKRNYLPQTRTYRRFAGANGYKQVSFGLTCVKYFQRAKLALLLVFFIGGLASNLVAQSLTEQNEWYQQAIVNAMSPEPSKVCSTLVAITPENSNLVWKTINNQKYLLVVTWKQNVSYYQPYLDSAFYNTGNYPIWITTATELKNRISQEHPADVNLRLRELLGLPPTSVYSYFVEFWVRPQDLFRPSPDAEIDDSMGSLCFPDSTSQAHIDWINSNRISRYYACNLQDKYPWTQLGYTYDWEPGNATHVGLSEFVIAANSKIVVNAIYTTNQYLMP